MTHHAKIIITDVDGADEVVCWTKTAIASVDVHIKWAGSDGEPLVTANGKVILAKAITIIPEPTYSHNDAIVRIQNPVGPGGARKASCKVNLPQQDAAVDLVLGTTSIPPWTLTVKVKKKQSSASNCP